MTIGRPCSVSGRGYWTGQSNTLTFLPAPAGSGVNFIRSDLIDAPRISAIVDNASGLSLRTRLGQPPFHFDMVEHVMAAIRGLSIDNIDVVCTSAEMPAMDGSSFPFALSLQSAGIVECGGSPPTFTINSLLRVGDQDRWIEARPTESSWLNIEYRLDYGNNSTIPSATYSTVVSELEFCEQLAAARTFITAAEAEQLQQKGLAAHVTHRDLLVFDKLGPIENELRFPDECARHKALDLIGDLALTGVNLVGEIIACKSGHQLNVQMARMLRQAYLTSTADADLRQSAA
ncbi:MAG: UDP-3-O-acyl-N-acetylglucosamine deacetylase [Planctomycetales bacterium]|nr:UDP-3-O-acyl-N-acetylglucosamine deacetylase [Planctomycetales bacterium]